MLLVSYTAQLRAIIKFALWTIVIDDPLELEDASSAKERIEGSIQSFLQPDADPDTIPHVDRFGQMYVSIPTHDSQRLID